MTSGKNMMKVESPLSYLSWNIFHLIGPHVFDLLGAIVGMLVYPPLKFAIDRKFNGFETSDYSIFFNNLVLKTREISKLFPHWVKSGQIGCTA